jgi:hypothetical protein
MFRTWILAATAVAAVGAATGAQANLLTNGSFELGTFAGNGSNGESLVAGSTAITGWTTFGHEIAWIQDPNGYGLAADDGNAFLDLTGLSDQQPFGGIGQTIGTVTGATYTVTFALGGSNYYNPGVASVDVGVGDNLTHNFVNSDRSSASTWAQESFTFVAAGTSTDVSFTGDVANEYIGLDNASVVCTSGCVASGAPEPATWAMMLVGFGGIGGMARVARRKRAVATQG